MTENPLRQTQTQQKWSYWATQIRFTAASESFPVCVPWFNGLCGSAFVLVYSFPENGVLSQLMQSSNDFWMYHKVHGCKVKPLLKDVLIFAQKNHISTPPKCRVPCSSSGSCDKAVTGRVDWPLLNSTVLKLHTSVLSQGPREADLSHHLVSEVSRPNIFVTDAVWEVKCVASSCSLALPQQTFKILMFIIESSVSLSDCLVRKYLSCLRTKPFNHLE